MTPQRTIAHYRITAKLGEGGMGEVWRATDTKLGREVAIKILPTAFAADTGRMARFEREAKVLASLNYPNIAAIYGVEEHALVMELVEGETLLSGLPLDAAFNYGRQIAEALEYAHERAVIHRDLKPANIKVTSEGVVKLLDFGLAKAIEDPTGPADDPANSPTLTLGATRVGAIMGTAAYMSPDQASGKKADRRADIWSFGAVLFEMLSGKKAFEGESVSDTLASVLKAEPDWNTLPTTTPPAIHNLIRRCLTKDRKQRLQAIGEARIVLEARGGAVAPQETEVHSSKLPWLVAAVTTIMLVAASVLLWRATRPIERPLLRISAALVPGDTLSTFRLDQNTMLTRSYPGTILALSADGTRLAAEILDADGTTRLAVRQLHESRFSVLRGTDKPGVPFFSPDGQWVAFVADGMLKKIPVQGGAALPLCEAGNFASGSWGDDGNVIAALNGESGGLPRGPLSRVPADGGTPTPVTELRSGEVSHRWPQVLPGSQAVVFTVYTSESPEDARVEVASLKTHERKTLVRGAVMGKYIAASSRAGFLVYLHRNTLFAAPFDLGKLALTRTPQPVLDDVSSFGTVPAEFEFSQTGILVYVSGTADPPQSIFWLNSSGQTEPLHVTPGYYNSMRFSHDGKHLAFSAGDATEHEDILVKNLARGETLRLTSLPGVNDHPVWTPDDKYIVFASGNQPGAGIYWVRADGSGEPQRLAGNEYGLPLSLSPDSKRLGLAKGTALIVGDPDKPRLGQLESFARTSGVTLPAFSPDFRWVAYRSNETGTPEVYVRPYPGLGAKWKISTGGGWHPIWSPNGHELFYLSFFDRHIMVVDYRTNGDFFSAGRPRVWSQKQILNNLGGGPLWPYGLAPDGKRFAVLLYPDGTADAKPTAQLTFLLNFVDYLRQRVPPSK
jgi:serine/threonine-protein kinase